MSTNFRDYKPTHEGEIVIFDSPHARDVQLVDVAETNRYGQLIWVAADSAESAEGIDFAADVARILEEQ